VVQEEAGKKFFVFGRPNNFNKKTPAGLTAGVLIFN
jgi:hypothetical protein